MTKKQLSQLYYLNRETELLQEELKEIQNSDLYKSPQISSLPKGKKIEDKIANHICELIDLPQIIIENLIAIQRERKKIEHYISNIKDGEIRLIMRLRHINGLTWHQIACELGYAFESSPRKKYNRYLNKNDNNNTK